MADSGGSKNRVRIYTRTGDTGSASLYNGERMTKDTATFAALGDVDELACVLGLAREFTSEDAPAAQPLQQQLASIQSRLLDVGSAVATPMGSSSADRLERVRFDQSATPQLEAWLDALDDQLPPLRNFILPSGGKAAAHLHLARAVCRRAERSVVPLVRDEQVDSEVGVYLNRLSDYLFTAARYAALKEEQPETVYKKSSTT